MKKNKFLISTVLFLIISSINISSLSIANANITINTNTVKVNINSEITKGDAFNFFADYYEGQIPSSYKYITVGFKDIKKGSKLESSLQKLIYLDLIENPKRILNENSKLSAWGFYRLSEKILKINIIDRETKNQLLKRNTNTSDLLIVKNFIGKKSINIDTSTTDVQIKQKQAILNDVYNTLTKKHYDHKIIDKLDIINGAIEGLAKGTNDKHTVYFPPIKSKTFHDFLSGEYEGIGSYVDMEKPGVLKITSPIPGSPSEKAGLKGGDIVTKVNSKEITKNNSLTEVITWIKGPAGTEVVLTINRNGKILDITVTREKIIITDIESKQLNSNTYYIQIKSFGEHVSTDFKKSIEALSKGNHTTKLIIDLRNDGGGYLNEVTEILSYFVPKGEKTAVVKYLNSNKEYISKGYEDIDFSKYKIVILQNSGTASASEILIGTLKDYYDDIEIIGEQSYGKGSVQVMKNYSDGSLLKYTIAKWFTGGTETGIDGVGITPTIELELDYEQYKNNGRDNQLEKAKSIR